MKHYCLNRFNIKNFLTGTIIALLSVVVFADKPAPELIWLYTISGYGAHEYFQNPQGIFFDSTQKELLIADTGNDSIGFFDSHGVLRFRLKANKRVSSPLSVVCDTSGNIYWSEVNTYKVKQRDFRGESIQDFDFSTMTVGLNAFIPGKLIRDEEGNIYLIDRANAQIVKLNSKGQFIKAFDGLNDPSLQGDTFVDLKIDKSGKIYLLTSMGLAVHIFDKSDRLIKSFGEHGPDDVNLSFPTGLAIDSKERIWVIDSFQHRIKVYTQKGDYLFQLGITGTENGQFYFPIDLTFDTQGHLYVLEKGTNRVQAFEIKE